MRFLYTILFIFIYLLSINTISAQRLDFKYLNQMGKINIYGGRTYPGSKFLSTSPTGLFAKNGYQMGFEYNRLFKYGLGIGVDLSRDWFGVDENKFQNYINSETMEISGGYSINSLGFTSTSNVPILLHDNEFMINLFVIGTFGFQFTSPPSIDLTYNELNNKYVKVSYDDENNTDGYLAYRIGVQFLIINSIGISFSYKSVMHSKNRFDYSVDKTDAEGTVYEDENYTITSSQLKSFQIGLTVLFSTADDEESDIE